MFSEINAKLVAIQGELRKRDKYKAQLMDYQKELETIEDTLSQLRTQIESEKEEVEKLEHFSLTNLFATLSGTKDEKLSKEKQEMIAAQHKLEKAKKTKMEIDEAILGLKNKLLNLKNAEYEYQQVLIQKENMIKSSTSPFAEKVFELSEQEGALKAHITQLLEAYDAGKRVERALSESISSLEKAENWGTWDILGGGTISSIVKHQHIDQAESDLHRAQTSMREFQKELLDVQETAFPEVNISGMLKFADFFFDGFIADFMVQGKIKGSLDQTRGHRAKTNDILLKLEAQSEKNKKELEKIQNEKQGIVERL
ncbi:hypothetical protein BACCIP111895_03875 [Neobacillus rhizosphaerae]|uniref:Uncharacterized protein n=1 Tax=Neobacillus rhizosphaerae TaxID=2880965 RepID=A0ABM9EVK5_9BACI|nr:hypothetical protein [Neobacillus rhizosphaerae]CAH2716687.1 hypothetical protein BACCIP111895_03875 [Neobacillus rhizosphaerae]